MMTIRSLDCLVYSSCVLRGFDDHYVLAVPDNFLRIR